MEEDAYKVSAGPASVEIKVKGSRFIARAEPCSSREEAEALVAEVKKRHYDATHNCYAYRVGAAAPYVTRFNDDGEPSGTAGRPILQAILTRELTNVCIVVTRYFGGTKLGTGGLIRAYGGAATQVLDAAGERVAYATDRLKLQYPYESSNPVMREIDRIGARVTEQNFNRDVTMTVELRKTLSRTFIDHIVNASAGRVTVVRDEDA